MTRRFLLLCVAVFCISVVVGWRMAPEPPLIMVPTPSCGVPFKIPERGVLIVPPVCGHWLNEAQRNAVPRKAD